MLPARHLGRLWDRRSRCATPGALQPGELRGRVGCGSRPHIARLDHGHPPAGNAPAKQDRDETGQPSCATTSSTRRPRHGSAGVRAWRSSSSVPPCPCPCASRLIAERPGVRVRSRGHADGGVPIPDRLRGAIRRSGGRRPVAHRRLPSGRGTSARPPARPATVGGDALSPTPRTRTDRGGQPR